MDVGSKYANDYGVIRIQYKTTIAGKEVRWFVEYLHLLVNDTGQKDPSGKNIFEARDKDGHQIWTFVPGVTKVKGHVQVGAVGGRGEGKDDLFDNHLHTKIGYFDVNGKEQGVDMRILLTQELHSVIASDAGADGNVTTTGDNSSTTVLWENNLNAWVAQNQTGKFAGVFYSHQNQQTADARTPGYWYAWDTGKKPEEMERVVWKQIAEQDVNGKKVPVMKWVKFNSTSWTTGKNVWDTSSQSWVDYSL